MTLPTPKQLGQMSRTDGPVHLWFGLSYASYAVQPRAVLQSMPTSWQQRFCDLMNEADEMGYRWPEQPGTTYAVNLRLDSDGRFLVDPLKGYRRQFIEPQEAPE